MGKLPTLNAGRMFEEFDSKVSESATPVVVFVRAGWCAIAKMAEPIVKKLATELKDRVAFYENETGADSGKIARRYGVRSSPTILVFKPGEKQPVAQIVGFRPESDLRTRIEAALK